ncbi:NUDIX domain-containing protein [Rhizobium halophilum]|uniref:NUDIX domain-containing protein n=1 Tax=Rhizobium halophilum TaxID=2846852 RepID=UPI001EFCF90B|nr:NUDIX domain-containing protein [Rhizobium halophilum]MCF6368633.1 NUDIX domain-containing protein [Rhizobium halophilum]
MTPGIDFPGVGTGLVIRRQDGMVLLYRRLNAPEAGYWNIVGGKVDALEASDEAARREAEEETGLRIGRVDFLCVTEEIIRADRQHWVSLIYVTDDFLGEPQLVEPHKLSDFGWFPPEALPEPLSVFATKAMAALQSRQ